MAPVILHDRFSRARRATKRPLISAACVRLSYEEPSVNARLSPAGFKGGDEGRGGGGETRPLFSFKDDPRLKAKHHLATTARLLPRLSLPPPACRSARSRQHLPAFCILTALHLDLTRNISLDFIKIRNIRL